MKTSKGFTLIELIIVMAVFLFIVGAALGIFISIVQSQRRVLAEQQFLNQISYVEEHMSKALRMADTESALTDPENYNNSNACLPPGYIYQLVNKVGEVYTGIKFLNASDGDACYKFYVGGTGTSGDPYILYEQKNNGTAVPLNSTNLIINSIRFSINGGDDTVGGAFASTSASVQPQPKVTILINVNVNGLSSKTIQTTVSRRNLNNVTQ